jgi:hypothetical protein
MPFGRGWFDRGGMGMGRGMGFGRGRGFGRGMGMGMGMGRGNPYPFCRFNPSLLRRWWAYGGGQYPPASPPVYGWGPGYGNQAPYYPRW